MEIIKLQIKSMLDLNNLQVKIDKLFQEEREESFRKWLRQAYPWKPALILTKDFKYHYSKRGRLARNIKSTLKH